MSIKDTLKKAKKMIKQNEEFISGRKESFSNLNKPISMNHIKNAKFREGFGNNDEESGFGNNDEESGFDMPKKNDDEEEEEEEEEEEKEEEEGKEEGEEEEEGEEKDTFVMDLIKAIFLPFVIIYLGSSTVQLFKCYKAGAMIPGQNLGRAPYTRSGADPNASFLSHKNYNFPYNLAGSNASAKGIIRETIKHTWFQTRTIVDMLLNTFRGILYSESLEQNLINKRNRKNVSWPYKKGGDEGFFKGSFALMAEFGWNMGQMIALVVVLVAVCFFSIYLLPIIAIILGVWQQIDIVHKPVLPIPEFILSSLPPGVPIPKNALMIHILSSYGAFFPLQILGVIIYYVISLGIIAPLLQLFTILIPVYVIYFLILRPFANKNLRTAGFGWFRYYVKRYYMIILMIIALGVSFALNKKFSGNGPISKILKENDLDVVVPFVSWAPAIIVGLFFFMWLFGMSVFKKRLFTLLKDSDGKSLKNKDAICALLRYNNTGGFIPSAFELLKPIKDAIRGPMQWLLDIFRKMAGTFRSSNNTPSN